MEKGQPKANKREVANEPLAAAGGFFVVVEALAFAVAFAAGAAFLVVPGVALVLRVVAAAVFLPGVARLAGFGASLSVVVLHEITCAVAEERRKKSGSKGQGGYVGVGVPLWFVVIISHSSS